MALSLSFSRSFRVVTHIIPKECGKSRGFWNLFVEIIISEFHSFVNEAFAMRIWSRSLAASVKRRLCRHEAKRTFFIFLVAKQRFTAKGCFMSCYATRLMHRRCASLQPNERHPNGCLSFGCGDGIWLDDEESKVRIQQWVICRSDCALSDWSVCARCGLVAPSWQYTATCGGMDPTPLSELMNNCKLECEQGWWKVQSATRSVHIERSSWGSKPISTQATKEVQLPVRVTEFFLWLRRWY